MRITWAIEIGCRVVGADSFDSWELPICLRADGMTRGHAMAEELPESADAAGGSAGFAGRGEDAPCAGGELSSALFMH